MRVNTQDALLALVVLIIVYYAEWLYPSQSLGQCSWSLGPNAQHVAFVADPQIVDGYSYPNRNWFFSWFTRVISDRYAARNFRLIHQKAKPDVVFFLGDLFDGGREWTDDKVWYDELKRFKQIFPSSSKIPHYMSLPGNHDVGSVDTIVPAAFERFRKVFGDANQAISIGDYTIVTLDTNALMNQKVSSIYQPVSEFYENLKANRGIYGNMIILTHIPLYRPEGAYCGFERESSPFTWVQGHQYVTEVNPVLSQDIFFKLRPSIVFSGDDHDVCKYNHQWTNVDSTVEYTVKSFSMAGGIRRPGFQMLSLGSHGKWDSESCLLGDPFFPIIFQGVTIGALLFGIFITSFWNNRRSSYDRIGDSEKGIAPRVIKRLPKDGVRRLAILSASWIVGQFLINTWSYTASI